MAKSNWMFVAVMLIAATGVHGAQPVISERTLSVDAALEIATIALANCRTHGTPVTITVLDHAGRLKTALEPWITPGQYLNFAEHQVDTSESFGAFTYRRLQVVKARVDPENLMHANHSL